MVQGLVGIIKVEKTSPIHTSYTFKFRIASRPRKLPRFKIFIPLSEKQVVKLTRFAAATKLFHRNSVVLQRDPEYRVIEWKRFYPFGASEKELKQEKTAPSRLGIGALAHLAVTEFIVRRFPTHFIYHPAPQKSRENHLRAMGIDPKQEYPAREYRRLVKAYFRKKRQRNLRQ